MLIVHRFVLNLATLVHRFHRTEHPAAAADGFKLLKDGFLHQVGEFVDDVGTLKWILGLRPSAFLVHDELDGQRTAHAVFGWGRDRLIVGVGVQ